MKKGWGIICVILLMLLTGAAWWATHRPAPQPQAAEQSSAPAAYPADMWERASRVTGFRLRCGGPPPTGLSWQDGMQEPEIGDSAARKGGRMRRCNVGPYPANFLAFGSPQPQFFHYNLFTAIEVPLVRRHPVTGNEIPGTASHWSVAGRIVRFRLNAAATYSNGRPVRAADYALGALLRAEAGCADALSAAVEEVCVEGDECLAVTLRETTLQPVLTAAALLHAAEPGFYAEFGSDYRKRYAHRIPPGTGGYTVGRTERGRMIELVRVRNWWAKDRKYYRYSCNADAVEHHFPTDEAQAWELLMRGRLDMLQTRNITAWHQRAETAPPPLQRHIFRAEYPLPPYGIAFNTRTLSCPHLRRGLMHALDMERAVQLIFRGEGERLRTFASGYGDLSPTGTPFHQFDVQEARAAFDRAGYTVQGADGILQQEDGSRLSIRLTYTPHDKISTLVSILVQSAAVCGAEIVPDAVPWQTAQRKGDEQRHQLLFWAAMPGEPFPDYRRFFGAGAGGPDAPFGVNDTALNAAMDACEQARTRDELTRAIAAADSRIAELCIWLPGWKENVVRLICHPRVRFPDCETCRFSTPTPYEVEDAHLYWIDTSPAP